MGRVLTPIGMGRMGDSATEDYNTIEIFDTLEQRRAKLEQWIAKGLGTAIVRRYNNRQWKVTVDLENQIVVVGCDSICNFKGYHIHMGKRTIHDLEIEAVKAAGEILERHNASRAKRTNPDLIDSMARDAHDSVIAIDAVAEPI